MTVTMVKYDYDELRLKCQALEEAAKLKEAEIAKLKEEFEAEIAKLKAEFENLEAEIAKWKEEAAKRKNVCNQLRRFRVDWYVTPTPAIEALSCYDKKHRWK